ncbi:hypothetical protein IFE17_02770 [Actinobacillus sp. GY-402]|nr:hypothetical protein IFE17_02770 [Actinobacillus sp. GY-402]
MEHKTFKFEKVSDFYQLNHEEFERFLEDFRIWFVQGKMMQELEQKVNAEAQKEGIENAVKVMLPDYIHWVDDNEPGVKSLKIRQHIHTDNGELVNNFSVDITKQ